MGAKGEGIICLDALQASFLPQRFAEVVKPGGARHVSAEGAISPKVPKKRNPASWRDYDAVGFGYFNRPKTEIM